MIIDIHSKGAYPADALSNFAPHRFRLDGVDIACMEAFLQSLKASTPEEQAAVCRMSAKEAKAFGDAHPWQTAGTLRWGGAVFSRYGGEYSVLLRRAYDAMLENDAFRQALRASGNRILWHSIGKLRRKDTCLTTFEFLGQLYRVRQKVRQMKDG